MNILGIESSCDETGAAIVSDGRRVLSNIIASQIEIHARYGGVVPEVASRQHLLSFPPVVERALGQAGLGWEELSAIAVTNGPGLAGSLLVGVNLAKAIALAHNLPLVPVNHLEGHIYANWLVEGPENAAELPAAPEFPLLCLIVSGGHTELVLMRDHGDYQRLGSTRDDAAGEAFDKVGRILGLGFPGGPAIQQAAESGDPEAFPVPRAWLRDSDDFSFSGVKTAMRRLIEEARNKPRAQSYQRGIPDGAPSRGGENPLAEKLIADLAASFQAAVVEVLVQKTIAAAERLQVHEVLLSGGVAANKPLRESLQRLSPVPVRYPEPIHCTDNAAMVAACGYFRLLRGRSAGLDFDVLPNAHDFTQS